MKASPFSVFVVALALGAVLTAGYALIGDRPPKQPAAHASAAPQPGESAADFSDGSRAAASRASGKEPGPVEAGGLVSSEREPELGAGALAGPAIQAGGAAGRAIQADGAAPGGIHSAFAAALFQPSSTGTSAGPQAPPTPRSAPIPLAFLPQAPEVAAANPDLAGGLQALQQNFVNAVGGPNQDPNDPSYYQRWINAQMASDEQYRLLVGNQAFLFEQMSVNNQ